MPFPTGLVVKNGSNIRGNTSGAIPLPVSAISIWMAEASQRVRTVMVPCAFSGIIFVAASPQCNDSVLGDRLCGVDQQVQENLIELRWHTLDLGNGSVVFHDLSLVLDLVDGDVQRRVKALMQIGQDRLGIGIGMGKTLQILNDPTYTRKAFERLVDEKRSIVAKVVKFQFAAQLSQSRIDRRIARRLAAPRLISVQHA